MEDVDVLDIDSFAIDPEDRRQWKVHCSVSGAKYDIFIPNVMDIDENLSKSCIFCCSNIDDDIVEHIPETTFEI